LTKKIEALELDNVELVLTFKELQEVFDAKKIGKPRKRKKTFDKFYNDYTKIYPLVGGLSDTLHYRHILKKREILVEDGIDAVTKILDGFKDGKYKQYRFLDLLSCRGCIAGPGMANNYTHEERRDRVIKYRDFARRYEKDLGRRGKIIHVEDIDFSRKFG
jgi:iron only hydrogenase large subunit-like protein